MIILEDNDLAQYVKTEVAEPNDDPGKLTFKKNMIKAKRIILESVNDHLLSNIDDLNTPKAMFDYCQIYMKANTVVGRCLSEVRSGHYTTTSQNLSHLTSPR